MTKRKYSSEYYKQLALMQQAEVLNKTGDYYIQYGIGVSCYECNTGGPVDMLENGKYPWHEKDCPVKKKEAEQELKKE